MTVCRDEMMMWMIVYCIGTDDDTRNFLEFFYLYLLHLLWFSLFVYLSCCAVSLTCRHKFSPTVVDLPEFKGSHRKFRNLVSSFIGIVHCTEKNPAKQLRTLTYFSFFSMQCVSSVFLLRFWGKVVIAGVCRFRIVGYSWVCIS